jgi:hypothetical protein
VRDPAGTVSVFVTGTDGTVHATSQQAADDNTGWTGWVPIGGSCASSPVAVAGSAVTVYCITRQGTLASAASAAGGWQPWQQVSTLSGLTGVPAVLTMPNGGTEVLAGTATGTLATAAQASPAAPWQAATGPAGASKTATAPAITTWPGGRVAVVSQLASGQIGYSVQQPAGSGSWSAWTALGSVVGAPAAWLDATGTPKAVALTRSFRIALTSYAAGRWSRWRTLGAGF